jgi:guanine nucleotide-binding protein subunit alpha
MRLSPLLHVQTVLIEHLACQFDDPSLLVAAHQFSISSRKSPDFVVRSNTSLKGFLGKKQNKGDANETHSRVRLDIHEVDSVLEACRDDMVLLWKDPVVREVLHRRDVRLEEGPGSLLNFPPGCTLLAFLKLIPPARIVRVAIGGQIALGNG